jgi:hypothetical protein
MSDLIDRKLLDLVFLFNIFLHLESTATCFESVSY